MEQAVLHDGLQNEVGHLYAAQIGVDVVFALQLRVTVAHQLHVGLQQLQLVVQRDHGPVHLHAEPEEIHQAHEQSGHRFVAVQLGLDADGVQGVVEKVGVDLAFQVEHGHLLLRQLCPENIRVFQRQIEGQRHQCDTHAADKPGVVQTLQNTNNKFNGQRDPDNGLFLLVDLTPIDGQQSGAQQQIEGDAPIGHQHVGAGGIVPRWGHCVGDRQQKIAQLRHGQKDSGRPVQPPGLSGLLLHQNGDILIKQIDHQHHAAQKQSVNSIV